jgi:hypothetical protein
MELTFQRESGSASFGAKVALSLNGVDPSFMNSVAGSYQKSQVAQISHMIPELHHHIQGHLQILNKNVNVYQYQTCQLIMLIY